MTDSNRGQCATCNYVRTFKARADERARYGFDEVGYECRKAGWEGYTEPFASCSFYYPRPK